MTNEKEKHAGGRPPKFNTPEEMQILVDKYFDSLNIIEDGIVTGTRPALVTGLALALGFCSRQSMYDYEKKPEFSCITKGARLRVESSYENALFSKASTGAIFGLKNMGWKDKQEIQHDGTIVSSSAVMDAIKRKHKGE